MIDIGPNLSSEQFNQDLPQVIERAIQANVNGFILTSTEWKSFQKNLQIVDKYQSQTLIKTTYGLHPHYAHNDHAIFQNIEKALSHSHVVALGEFGLDYFRMLTSKEKQIEVMERFIEAGKKYPHLSLFLHEREAFDDFVSILKQKGDNHAVVHCFTGNKEQAKVYLDLDCYIGVTGWISDKRRNNDIKQALEYIPLDKLLIETDSPYLTPFNMPNRPRRNEPAFLEYVAKSVAEIKHCSLNDVIEQTTQNALDFFSLHDYNIKMKLK